MSDDWGPWIEHDGRGCPVKGMWVKSEERCGLIEEHIAGGVRPEAPLSAWVWDIPMRPHENDIIRYRIRRPKALQQLIQMVENLPSPVKEKEDA